MSDNVIRSHDLFWLVGGADTDDHLVAGHEAGLLPILAEMASPDKVTLVVGAHVGLHALTLAANSKHVYAVEANPKTYAKLEKNIELNDLGDKVTAIQAVAWDVDDETVMLTDVNDKDTGGSTRAEDYKVLPRGQEKHSFKTTTLDTYGFADVGLVVIDVEGAEARVLHGLMGTLEKYMPDMVIELHEGHPGTDPNLRQQVYSILNELQYSYVSVDITGERLLCSRTVFQDEPESVRFGE